MIPTRAPSAGVLPDTIPPAVCWALETAVAPFCGRWKPAIIWLLGRGHQRYNALAARLPGRLTSKVLTEQLKDLVRDGLVAREEIPGSGKHVKYALTQAGESLLPIVEQLEAWGRDYGCAPPRVGEHGRMFGMHDTQAPIPQIDERYPPVE